MTVKVLTDMEDVETVVLVAEGGDCSSSEGGSDSSDGVQRDSDRD